MKEPVEETRRNRDVSSSNRAGGEVELEDESVWRRVISELCWIMDRLEEWHHWQILCECVGVHNNDANGDNIWKILPWEHIVLMGTIWSIEFKKKFWVQIRARLETGNYLDQIYFCNVDYITKLKKQ